MSPEKSPIYLHTPFCRRKNKAFLTNSKLVSEYCIDVSLVLKEAISLFFPV